MPIEVYSTSETVEGGTVSFLFAHRLDVGESFYLEYDEKDLEYIQSNSLSSLYEVKNTNGRLTVSFKTNEIVGESAQFPNIEFKVLSTTKNKIEVKIDSDNEMIKNSLYGGWTKDIKIASINSSNDIDNNTDNDTNKEEKELSNNDIILYVSLGLNAILLITTIAVSLKKKITINYYLRYGLIKKINPFFLVES